MTGLLGFGGAWRWRLSRSGRTGSDRGSPHGRGRMDEVSRAAAIDPPTPGGREVSAVSRSSCHVPATGEPAPVMAAEGWMRHRPVVPTRPRPEPDSPPDARAAARDAGLRYATDTRPGITRARSGKGFTYRDPDGTTDPRPRGHRAHPATGHPPGLDRRLDLPLAQRPPPGHRSRRAGPQAVPLSRATGSVRRGSEKFDRMLAFADALPRIRRRCDRDLGTRGLLAREGPGRGRAAPRDDAHPGRQRRVRPAQSLVRADDAARPPRPDRGRGRAVPVPREVRPAA